ncbi:MAG: glycoside hydrolase family 31 protein, partial [Longimicrobiales bacterium]|nr:glycoside hydrolase family 31 protein [Longimicrobiales bacterium]
LLGPSLLVAPVLGPGGHVTLYLPEGGWYDLANGERVEGPRALRRTVPLDQMPMYGREGHLLPLGPVVQHTGELGKDELGEETLIEEVWVFGAPCQGIELNGLPPGVRVRHW